MEIHCFPGPSIAGTSLRTVHPCSQGFVSLHNCQNRSHRWVSLDMQSCKHMFPCTSNCLCQHHSRLYFGQSKFLVGKNVITARACGALAGGSGITPVLSTLQDIWQAHRLPGVIFVQHCTSLIIFVLIIHTYLI